MALMVASPLFNGNTVYKSWTNKDGTVLMPQTYDKELWKKAADAAKVVIDMPEYEWHRAPEGASFDEIVDNFREITTTWGADKNKEMIWGYPNSLQWYAMCALPARWYGWNGRYSLAIGMVNDFFMADGSVSRPLEEWFADKQFSTEDGNGTIANTFWMFVGREPRFYASIHFPNQRLSYDDAVDLAAERLEDRVYDLYDAALYKASPMIRDMLIHSPNETDVDYRRIVSMIVGKGDYNKLLPASARQSNACIKRKQKPTQKPAQASQARKSKSRQPKGSASRRR